MLWRIRDIWDCFWYYRHGKVRFHVFDLGDSYNAFASNGNVAVWNCYGSTPEQAKEMAMYRLKQAMEKEPKEQDLVVENDHIAIYREK
jgi:hypothetical protein